jgi:hypothetical protein
VKGKFSWINIVLTPHVTFRRHKSKLHDAGIEDTNLDKVSWALTGILTDVSKSPSL